jgi:hypothetical protein
MVTFIFAGIAEVMLVIFNLWVLRRRPDQQHPWRTLLLFPFYKLLTMALRWFALWYNLFYYTPFIRNRIQICLRQDLPLGPDHVAMIDRLVKDEAEKAARAKVIEKEVHGWDTISKLLNKEAQESAPLSHWFLSCVSKLTFRKDNPREKILLGSYMKKQKKVIGKTEQFFYPKISAMATLAPLSFLACLNTLCFLSRKPRCMGKDPERAVKILKWLWVEEVLGEGIHNTDRIKQYLKDFALSCEHGMSLHHFVGLMKEVIKPTLQFLDTPPQIIANILHLAVAHDDHQQWVLKSLSLTSTDDRLIVRQYLPEYLRKIIESNLPAAIFVPIPSVEDGTIEPFHPSTVHAVIFLDPAEEFILVNTPFDAANARVCAVFSLLELSMYPQFKQTYFMSATSLTSCRLVSNAEIHRTAQFYFSSIHPPSRTFEFYESLALKNADATTAQINQLFKQPDDSVIDKNSTTSSGFWLLPVIDVISGPILFLDPNDKILDIDQHFVTYGSWLPFDYKVQTNPSEALKKKILLQSGASFLNSTYVFTLSWLDITFVVGLYNRQLTMKTDKFF